MTKGQKKDERIDRQGGPMTRLGALFFLSAVMAALTYVGGCDDDDDSNETSNSDGDSDGDTDGDTDGDADSDTGPEPFVAPPEWLLGMWLGTDSADAQKVAIFQSDDICFGDVADGAQSGIMSYAAVPETDEDATFEVHTDDGTTYSYTISHAVDGASISITETFKSTGDTTLTYSYEMGDDSDEFEMTNTPASDFIVPPAWLQGQWEGSLGKDSGVFLVEEDEMSMGYTADALSTYSMYMDMDSTSTFSVITDDGTTYSFRLKIPVMAQWVDTFKDNGDGTLTYTNETTGSDPTTGVLTRQE